MRSSKNDLLLGGEGRRRAGPEGRGEGGCVVAGVVVVHGLAAWTLIYRALGGSWRLRRTVPHQCPAQKNENKQGQRPCHMVCHVLGTMGGHQSGLCADISMEANIARAASMNWVQKTQNFS